MNEVDYLLKISLLLLAMNELNGPYKDGKVWFQRIITERDMGWTF